MRSEGQRLQHTIAFADEATPTRKANPVGVMGAEMIRAAPVRRKRLTRYAKNIGLSPPTLPYGRGSDRHPPPTVA
ncbi:MAG: hypothetical protein KKB50_12405 [Planctomycetes bacterium]|nr:hypothetical protein [Planctomycetota bacterium]